MSIDKLTVRRIIASIIGILLIFGSFKVYTAIKNSKKPLEKKEKPVSIRKLEVLPVTIEELNFDIPIQGRTVPFQKLTIIPEVSGVLEGSARIIKPGTKFSKGEILLRINSEELYTNTQSQKSGIVNAITRIMPDLKLDYPESFQQWQNYLNTLDLKKSLPALPTPVNEREKLFINGQNIYAQYYAIQTNEVRLAKHVIRAPFNGVITEGDIPKGTLIRANQPLGILADISSFELEVPLTLDNLKHIKIGNKISLVNPSTQEKYNGTVKRIGDIVDNNTQSVTVYLSISGKEMRENLFLQGNIKSLTLKDITPLPRSAVVGDSMVYVVNNQGKVLAKKVSISSKTEQTCLVKGLQSGEKIVVNASIGILEGEQVEPYQN